jgi:N-acetylmuramoyl-L-alanine amidase
MAGKGEGAVKLMRSIHPVVFLIAVAVTLACARKPPEPSLAKLYERIEESVEDVDLSGLRGRKIVIDPGHGGAFAGAVGVRGLKESDVNLGVALYLWGLLKEAGVDVTLTRATDRDFVGGDSLRLRDDLEARTDIVRSVQPDLLISLHHNAEPGGDSSFNEIQIYYRLDDTGPSLDVARLMARHLLLNLGEPDCRVVPGNYYVLRNSPSPAILCEPSYISNPVVENRLKLAEKQRLEAESYFLGLVDYFSRGVPRVATFGPQGQIRERWPRIDAVFDTSAAVDASTVRIALDGRDLDVSNPEPNRFVAFPPGHLPSGRHSATVSARGIGGNASPRVITSFLVSLRPAIVKLTKNPARANPPYPQRVSAIVADANGNPVADSTVVEFIWDGGKVERPTVGGRASVFVGRDLGFDRTYIAAVCEGVPGDLKLTDRAGRGTICGFVTDATASALSGAMVMEADSGGSVLTDEYGFFSLKAPKGISSLEVTKKGYRKAYFWVRGNQVPLIQLDRLYAGLPPATRITIDPAGGGEETGYIGPAGTRASDLNLAVAAKLAHLLESAGIEVRLTRDDDIRVTPEERVRSNEAMRSDLFVSIGHGRGAETAAHFSHYHSSARGIEMAGRAAACYSALVGATATTGPTADYAIQQTSSPAIKVVFTTPDTVAGEENLADVSRIWNRAYALFCAVLAYRGVEEDNTFSVEGRVTRAGVPAARALVIVDGALEVMTDTAGAFSLMFLDKTDHTVQAYSTTGRSAPNVFGEDSGYLELELE